MHRIHILIVLFAATLAPLSAQETAPPSVSGRTAAVIVSEGSGSFPTIGGYRLAFATSNPSYTVTPLNTTITPSTGTYTYQKTGPNTARLTVTDTRTGLAVVQSLIFSSPSSASYAISSPGGTQTGTLVFENVTVPPASPGLINLSVRAQVLAGSQIIPGLVLDTPTKVLIRAAGPALAGFGVSGTLSNPRLTVLVGDRPIMSNDDWSATISNYDAVRDAARKSGAFPFAFGSRDAAIVADLSAGSYTVLVTGDGVGSGEVLLEVYRVAN